MQILRWLFEKTQNNSNKQPTKDGGDEPFAKDIILYKNTRSKRKKPKPFIKACFYSSFHLRRVGSFEHWAATMKKKKEDIGDLAGNRVVPMSEAPATTTTKNDKKKHKNSKTLSRMKELLRWAAAAKSEKGSIGRKLKKSGAATVKAAADALSNESPKISFRWDVESCSNSAISAPSLRNYDQSCDTVSFNPIRFPLHRCSSRRGNWITTDSEFVVLEL